ncbi:ATP-binding protein [Mameliella sp.]|uniref:ATP-binding protein n=1 Tax=Mameliella sp. TaxID=1924940 RepID=UPI003BAA0107
MKIVLGQLLRNAGEHGARQVLLRSGSEGGAPFLQVQDDGTGISPGNAARVFDPFFTTRRGEGGTGMGLAIVRNLLTAHGAGIRLLPADRGTRLGIRFASAER